MIAIAVALALVLAAIAAFHVYWGVGGVWPGTDPQSCARAVTGFRRQELMPPPGASFAVAICLTIAALWPLAQAALIPSPVSSRWLAAGAITLALVFLGRGILGFTPAWRRLTPEEPFATRDVRYFSPLCILLGLGFVFLAVSGFSA